MLGHRAIWAALGACLVGSWAMLAQAAEAPGWPQQITGTLTAQGKPVAGGRVRLDIERIREFSQGRADEVVYSATVTSDAAGKYVFDLTEAVRPVERPVCLMITANAPELAETKTWNWYQTDKRPIANSFGSLKMEPVRHLQGRVLDPAGKPVPGAVIRTHYTLNGNGRPIDLRICDEHGQFELPIPRGAIGQVWVVSPDWAPQRMDLPDQDDKFEVRLEPGTAITGTVKDADGKPVAGTVVAIEALDRGESDRHNYVFLQELAVRTDAAGAFRLPPVRGEYKLYLAWAAHAAGVAEKKGDRLVEAYVVADSAPPAMLPEWHTLGDDKELSLPLQAGETLVMGGTIRWPDGKPAEGVEVWAFYSPQQRHFITLAKVLTDKEGSYAVELPSPIEKLHLTIPSNYKDAKGGYHRAHPDPKINPEGAPGDWRLPGPYDSDLDDLNWVMQPEKR